MLRLVSSFKGEFDFSIPSLDELLLQEPQISPPIQIKSNFSFGNWNVGGHPSMAQPTPPSRDSIVQLSKSFLNLKNTDALLLVTDISEIVMLD